MDITTRPDLLPLLSPLQTPALTSALDLPGRSGNKGEVKESTRESARESARAAAEKFEAFFLRTVLEDMIPPAKEDAFGGGGNAERIWSSQLHEQYAEILAKRGGIGIADLVYQQLLTLQEAAQEVTQETIQEVTQETTQATPSQQLSPLKEQAR